MIICTVHTYAVDIVVAVAVATTSYTATAHSAYSYTRKWLTVKNSVWLHSKIHNNDCWLRLCQQGV